MNTRRTRRNIVVPVQNEEIQEVNNEVQSRKRQKSKFDCSDDDSNPAKKVSGTVEKELHENIMNSKMERKRSKFDTDDEGNSSDDAQEQNTSSSSRKRRIAKLDSDENGSSSDSSVGDYLKAADEIDLDSSFFNFDKNEKLPDFAAIEKKMFNGIQQLSDSGESENDDDNEESIEIPEIRIENSQSTEASSSNFSQLQDYNKKMEEAKTCVEKYQSKKNKEGKKRAKFKSNQDLDVTHLLSVGETKNRDSIDSSKNDFDSDDEMDWEEIEDNVEKVEEKVNIPKEGVQIRVELPSVIRKKKKGVDLMDAIKRRINRVKKENQVFVHKVHLLCWIAHGNFLNNSVLNNEILLGKALSLLPSDQCYPPKHADMKYLEQIVRWYGKIMKLQELPVDNETPIKEQLDQQISKKQASCKRNFVLLFIIILRSLGLQCRLVLSFQCLPLRPPSSQLCSLSTKEKEPEKANEKTKPENAKASTSKESNSKSKSKNKPASVNASIKNKLNQSLNQSKSSVTTKIKKSNQKETKSQSNKTNELSDKIENDSASSSKKNRSIKSKSENSVPAKSSKKISIKKRLDRNLSNNSEAAMKNKNKTGEKETKSEKIVEAVIHENGKSVATRSKKISIKERLDRNLSNNFGPVMKHAAKLKKTITNKSNVEETKSEKVVVTNESSNSVPTTSSKKLSIKERLDRNRGISSELAIKNEVKLEDTVKYESVSSKIKIVKEKVNNNDSKPIIKKEVKLNETFTIEPSKNKATKSLTKLSLKQNLDRNFEDDSKLQVKKEIKLDKSSIKITQVDGADDSPPRKIKTKTSKKSSLSSRLNKNLENDDNDFYSSQKHHRQARNKPVKYVDNESMVDSDFQPSQGTSSPAKSPIKDINHNKRTEKHIQNIKTAKKTNEQPSTSKSATKSIQDVRGDIINLLKGHMTEQRHIDKSKLAQISSKTNDSDYDSDFIPEPVVKKRRSAKKLNTSNKLMSKIEVNTKVKRRVLPRSEIDRRALSSDDSQDDPNKKKKVGNDVWVEVFLEEEEKWISVDLIKAQVHCVSELHNRASHPISYIVAWNNNLSLKDITARYCPNWNTVTRKLRIDSTWWNQSLKPFIGVKSPRDKEEDEDLARQQLDKPLPTTISEYKNHPLYALKRHLLKFEAIYPPDAVTLGFVRGEAVYARECVHTLHSREIWVKHAKVVRPGQQPYKIVKARPKYDKLTGNMITDLPLEVFGNWQIEDYVPPTAENGVVPRNAYGNVELFKSCMLPKKTVHLQLPSLNKVARKLRIDCAPAVVGFDFHSGGSHPTFDGYVVCEEFQDVLIAAWEEDREETAKKEVEKYEKRVYGNWRKLIKGLFIRERLKARYDFGNPSSSVDAEKSKKKVKPSKHKKSRVESEEEPDKD